MAKINLMTISKQIYDAVNAANVSEDKKLIQVKELLESAKNTGIPHVVDSYMDIETGNTSLHLATQLGHTKLIELLLDYGANRKKLNAARKTPLDCLTQKTTNTTLITLINKKKVAINTSKQALSHFSLEHKQQIKNKKGDTLTVYGVTPEGELCVCVNGSSKITILKGVTTRKHLIDKKYVLGNPLKPIIDKSSLIHISQKQQPQTLTVKQQRGKRIKINCSADLLKDQYDLTFMQKIQRNSYYDDATLTVYGIYDDNLCCYREDQVGVVLIPATSRQELYSAGYSVLEETGVIDEKIIVDGYRSNVLAINSNPKDLEETTLTPFQKYNTPSGVATLYGLSNDNDKKAILLNDKNQFLQIIDPKEITPLFEETRKKLDPIKNPPSESNLKATLDKLNVLSAHISNEITQYISVRQIEAETTLNDLKSILNDSQLISEEQLKNALKVFLAKRWDRIKDSPHFSYINNIELPTNQLCIHIAQIIDPAHRNEILIPTLKYPDDTNSTNINQLEFGQFILTSDGEQFIDLISLHKNALVAIKQGQQNYYEISEFHQVLMEDGTIEKQQRQRNLNNDEINRLRSNPQIEKFIDFAGKKLNTTKQTALGVLQQLRVGLSKGDVYANRANDNDAGFKANLALTWFSQLYLNMPLKDKAKLDKVRLGDDLETLGYFIKTKLLIENPTIPDMWGNLPVYTCIEQNGLRLQRTLELRSAELETIPMGEGTYKEIGADRLGKRYLKVMDSLKSHDIFYTSPVTVVDHIRFIPGYKIEFDQYIKEILNNNITSEPPFLKSVKSGSDIQRQKNALEQYLDYPPETKEKLIDFLLNRPVEHESCLKIITAISSTYVYEAAKSLVKLLLFTNFCDIKFSEDYLKIISRFTELYGEKNAAKKITDALVGKASNLTHNEHRMIYLFNKIDTTIKILSDQKADMVKNNLLGMTCAKELLSNLLSKLLANNLSDNELNEIKYLQSIFARKCEGPMLTDLIRSELKKIDMGEDFKNLIQKFILEAKSPTNEEILSLNKLIHTSRNMKNLSSDLANLIHLLLNKDINIDQNRAEYKTLVYKIKSSTIPKKEILLALKHILSKMPISDDLKIWIMDFVKVMVTKQPEASIADATRLQMKKNSRELITPIINGLKKESICLENNIDLQDLIHNNHALFSSLGYKDIHEIISRAAIDLNPILVSNLALFISEARPKNYKRETVEKDCREINNKILLSYLVSMILNHHKSIYDDAGIFTTLRNYLRYQSISEAETVKIIEDLKLFPDQISEDIKIRITKFLTDISDKEKTLKDLGVKTPEEIRLDHCSHEKLRTEVKKLVSQEINNLEKIKDNLNVNKDSGSSFDKYNAAHQTIFEAALGDKNNPAPGTLHNLHASLDSGTINLAALKTGITTITEQKLITPFVTLDEDTSTINKVRHWVQNMFSRLDRFLFKQQKSSTIDIKDAQRSLTKNCNAFFSKRSLDQPKAREAVGPVIVAITA